MDILGKLFVSFLSNENLWASGAGALIIGLGFAFYLSTQLKQTKAELENVRVAASEDNTKQFAALKDESEQRRQENQKCWEENRSLNARMVDLALRLADMKMEFASVLSRQGRAS